MTALLIILAVLAVLNLTPIGARVLYDERGLRVRAVLGLIEFEVLPGKTKTPEQMEAEEEKKKKKAAEKAKKKKKKQPEDASAPEDGAEKQPLGAKLEEFLPLIRLGLKALGGLRHVFTVRRLTLRVTYGGADAGKIARNYGLAWSVAGAGMALLTRAFRVKRYDVEPALDYTAQDLRITADACVTLTLGRLVVFGVRYGIQALRLLGEKKKLRKGGAEE